ncbi:hypothetical protein [Xanthomonas arboricola]|uniref:hypothetical protein n=1 Tax=Xanthomonas arboricola TaxID=56448 RepID=UPI0011B0AF0E|nr:hypothetical protein [Xanthomonas arboricola]
MKEEGLLSRALIKIKQENMEARWIANQASYNFSDTTPISSSQKASIAFAVLVLTKNGSTGPDDDLVSRVLAANTLGDLRAVMDDVNQKIID